MDVILQYQMYYMHINMSFDLRIEVRYAYCENDVEAKFHMENSMVVSRTITRNYTVVKPIK